MRPPIRREQRTAVYDGLHNKREESKARANRREPARQTPPLQGLYPVSDALWKWKPVQYIQHMGIILGYVVSFLELANESRRCPGNQPQYLHPNPRDAIEVGAALVKATEHKCMNKSGSSIKSQSSEQ